MEDWEDRGVDSRIAGRLAALGLSDDAALTAWLDAHPNGSERLGRVMAAELRMWLSAQGETT